MSSWYSQPNWEENICLLPWQEILKSISIETVTELCCGVIGRFYGYLILFILIHILSFQMIILYKIVKISTAYDVWFWRYRPWCLPQIPRWCRCSQTFWGLCIFIVQWCCIMNDVILSFFLILETWQNARWVYLLMQKPTSVWEVHLQVSALRKIHLLDTGHF